MTQEEAAGIARELVAARGAERRALLRRAARPEVVGELKRLADAVLGVDGREALRRAELAYRVGRDGDARMIGEHAIAKALHAAGRHDDADGHYRAAALGYERQGRTADRARVDLARVDVLCRLGRFQEAGDLAKHAERFFRRSGDAVGAAKILGNLANVRQEQNRHREAVRLLDRARPAIADAGLMTVLAHLDLNRANSHSALAEFDRSSEWYATARVRYQELGQDDMVALVDYNWAYDDFLQGRIHDARRKLKAAQARFRGGRRADGLAHACQDEAEICLLLGLNRSAAEAAAEARQSFVEANEPLAAARATVVEARAALARGDARLAEARLRDARRTFRRLDQVAGLAEVDLLTARVAGTSPVRRRRAASRALDRFRGLRLVDRVAETLTELAGIDLGAGRLDAARTAYRAADRIARRKRFLDIEIRAQHGLARVAGLSGHSRSILGHYRRALDAYEGLRAGVRAEGDRLGLASSRHAVFVDAVRAALDQNRIEDAFTFVERARARALVDLLATDARFAGAAMAGGGTLERRLRALKRELARVDARAGGSERRVGAAPAPSAESLRILAQIQGLFEALAQRRPEATYALAGYPTVGIDELRELLGDRTLVAYFIDHDAIGALVINAGHASAHRGMASRSAVDRQLHTFRFALDAMRKPSTVGAEARQAAATAALSALGAMLVAPLERAIGSGPLVIVPHALLHHVPFPALYHRGNPLMEEREVSVCPSATVLAHALRRPEARGGALVVAAPDPLAPNIEREARKIAAALGARLLVNAEANASNVRSEAPKAAVVHFGTHGVYEPEAPLLSGLTLADGRLTVPEIAALGLRAELVTLAACDSARGSARGDEVLGLGRAFLHAGTRSLLSSLWAIDDDATADFMIAFYQEVARGRGVTVAHRVASLEARRLRPHPYFWAPFIVTGAWGVVNWKPVFPVSASGEHP